MADDKTSFNTGFAIGFLAALTLCFVYSSVLAAERRDELVPPVEVYKFRPTPIGEAEPTDPTVSRILRYGVPDRGPRTLTYKNHVVGYDQARKIPAWVAEHITKESIEGDSDRDKCSFRTDEDRVDESFSSRLGDYNLSGYDRGHMSPAADHKYSQDAMCDSFYLTNVVPQDSQFNRRYWLDVERYCRDLAGRYEEVRVVSGPLLLPETGADAPADGREPRRFVRYEVIGENNVTVPTHLFKVIVVENSTESANTSLFVGAFVFPNKPLDPWDPLIGFQVPLTQLEAAAGHRFFPRLAAAGASVGNLCSLDPCRLGDQAASGLSLATMGSLSSAVLAVVSVSVWVYLMYLWREHVQRVHKT